MGAVFVSFFTSDDYYQEAARKLQIQLEQLGLVCDFERVDRNGRDWAATTRIKLGVLRRAIDRHPGSTIFWIDADSQMLNEVPKFVLASSADFIGFQRGFASPNRIGYSHFSRFWHPAFFGLSNSEVSRDFLTYAITMEQQTAEPATDDFFIEEAWRKFGSQMSFQVIPSEFATSKLSGGASKAFFCHGASGNVAKFQNKVIQHSKPLGNITQNSSRSRLWRIFDQYNSLPPLLRQVLFSVAKTLGLVSLVRRQLDRAVSGFDSPVKASVKVNQLTIQTIGAAKRGDQEAFRKGLKLLSNESLDLSNRAKSLGGAYLEYLSPAGTLNMTYLSLRWWDQPELGNFGDWLSPLIVSELSGHPLHWVGEKASLSKAHLLGLGSIARLANENSIVFGSGISAREQRLDPRSRIISVRGPATAAVLSTKQKRSLLGVGDPGILLRRVVPDRSWQPAGPGLLVRHYAHQDIPISLASGMKESSVHARGRNEIYSLLDDILESEFVVTSAMHVLVACHSFGVPVALVDFEGHEGAVSGDGVKYEDYSLGVGLSKIRPVPLPQNAFQNLDSLKSLVNHDVLPDHKLDEVDNALRSAISLFVELNS